jgi:ferredoxin
VTTELYWFSGTGNTLHVARGLQERLAGATLVPIVGQLRRETIRVGSDAVGIVFPLHGMTLPVPVRMLLERLDPGASRYLFAVATRGGTICRAFEKADRILARKERRLDARFLVTMPSNDPKLAVYVQPSPESFAVLDEALPGRLDRIAAAIRQRAPADEEDHEGVSFGLSPIGNRLMEGLVLFAMALVSRIGVNNYFYSDQKCNGCGTCQKVCLSGKVRLVDKRPTWQRNVKCYFCYSCLNYCPQEAVQIKSKWYMKSFTTSKGRYPHPYASASEVAEQKAGLPSSPGLRTFSS